MVYDKRILFRISDYSLQLILPQQLRNLTQRHQITCGGKICIQAGTYQESLNHWRNRRLRYIKNHTNSLTRGSVEKLNVENIFLDILMFY